MFYKMLSQLLKNWAVKYQILQSAGPIELVKCTLIKYLGWNVKALFFGLQEFGIIPFYQNRKNLKRNVKVKLDLTKKRYSIFAEATKLVKNNEVIDFVMVDINYSFKVIFRHKSFFSNCDNFLVILNKEGIN